MVDEDTVIGKDLFKKETDISLFIGLNVTLDGKIPGYIEGSFGSSGQVWELPFVESAARFSHAMSRLFPHSKPSQFKSFYSCGEHFKSNDLRTISISHG